MGTAAKCISVEIYAVPSISEMETGRVDRHQLGRPAGWVAGWVEILRPVGQAS